MKHIIIFILLTQIILAKGSVDPILGMYIQTFGDSKNQAILYVHGGPDYNSHDFEITSAVKLSDMGYFVVTYDQKGQGRSLKTNNENYTYEQYAIDIKSIINKYNLKKTILLGHSHGGLISVHTKDRYPDLINRVVLLGAPMDWITLTTDVISNCRNKYTETKNSEYLMGLNFVDNNFKTYDQLTLEQKVKTISWLFIHANNCELYDVSKPTKTFEKLKQTLKDTTVQNLIKENRLKPMPGFTKNENYIRSNVLKVISRDPDSYCGIYGSEDGLFTKQSLNVIKKAIDPDKNRNNFTVIQGTSHNVYIQTQNLFFESLKKTCKL